MDWVERYSSITVPPATIANTPKRITLNQEMVEACLLKTEEGIAIVLLNWSGMPGPINDLTMTINDSTTPIPGWGISSAQGIQYSLDSTHVSVHCNAVNLRWCSNICSRRRPLGVLLMQILTCAACRKS